MNRPDFVDEVFQRLGGPDGAPPVSRRDVARIVETMEDTIVDLLAAGDNVALIDFATFTVHERAAQTVPDRRCPGERVAVPAHRVVKFSPSRRLRDAVRTGAVAPRFRSVGCRGATGADPA